MITLTKIFSREKTAFYFTLWNDSDRRGYERFLGYKMKHNLFLIPPAGEKGSVWYSKEDVVEMDKALEKRLNDLSFEGEVIKTFDTNWEILLPYLKGIKVISSPDELLFYYEHLVEWWSAMTSVFGMPDKENAPPAFRERVLAYRAEAEKYTEKMDKIFVEYWKNTQYPELVSVITPNEAAEIALGKVDESQINEYRVRLQGCFMYERKIYPMTKLDEMLKTVGAEFEREELKDISEVKGRTAYPGKVTGAVKIVRLKTDTAKIAPGDILVTEMTNPDYVPFMKIAGAVVTEEGGTTCHAAIASRELKVPCIVGTKIATKIFKDGDMVEVDAENGMVRRIG